MATTVEKNLFTYNDDALAALNEQLKEAIKPFRNDKILAIYQSGVENRVLGFVSVFGNVLEERLSEIPPESPIASKAQTINSLISQIRKEMNPLLKIYETASQKVLLQIEQLLKEQGLEDTPENRRSLVEQARDRVRLQTKEWFVLRFNDFSQGVLQWEDDQAEEKKAEAIAALQSIQGTKTRMDQQIKDGVQIDPKAQMVYEAVMAQVSQIDPDGVLVKEAQPEMSWTEIAKEVAVIAIPPIVGIGILFAGMQTLGLATEAMNTYVSYYLGPNVVSAVFLTLSLNGMYYSVKQGSVIGSALSANFLYNRLMMLDYGT